METTIRLRPDELTEEVLQRLKLFVKSTDEVLITVKNGFPPKENTSAYFLRLSESIDDIENNRNLVSFTFEEFKTFSQSLQQK
jgi:hypothetical protein